MPSNKSNNINEIKLTDDNTGSLYEYIEVVLKYKKVIIYIISISFISSLVGSLAWPKMYKATTRVLSPRENGIGLASILANNDDLIGGLSSSLINDKSPAALYVGIMRSRSVVEALDKKFDLKKLYGYKYMEDVSEKLDERTAIVVTEKNQIISISVRDRDPVRAADMANAYVEILDKINRKLNTTQGKSKRIFLEERLGQVRNNLEHAELSLKTFQQRYHLFSIDEQAKVAIEGAAKIKSQIIEARTELEVFKQLGTEKQVEAHLLKAKIQELERQLSVVENGTDTGESRDRSKNEFAGNDMRLSFGKLPDLGMQLMRRVREVKIQEKLYELLTAQYEMAQIEEAKDMDTIQILDQAKPPEKRHSPKVGIIVTASVIISAALSILLSFLIEYCGSNPLIKASKYSLSRNSTK